MGYIAFVIGTMVVIPIVSFLIERPQHSETIESLGKWFIFWGVGMRLFVAGIIQILKPSVTASILGVDKSASIVVRELGFANLLFGMLGIFSLFNPSLRLAATVGGFYMGAAGIYHIIRYDRWTGKEEIVAMVSDLWILIVVLVYCYFEFQR